MRILLIKTSSLGDVIHNLPVVADIRGHFADAQIDWVVEENFAAIPRLHPQVSTHTSRRHAPLAQTSFRRRHMATVARV